MRFDIKYSLVLSVAAFSSCAAPPNNSIPVVTPTPSATVTVKPTSTAQPVVERAVPHDFNDVLVLQRDGRLEAIRSGQMIPQVLRDKFHLRDWNLSSDGKQLCSATEPEDIFWFNAGSPRDYLFTVNYYSTQRVLLAAYGPRGTEEESDFGNPSFFEGRKKIVLNEGTIAISAGDINIRWISIYNTRTRKRLWDSRVFIDQLQGQDDVRKHLLSCNLSQAALSPDGNDIMCFALQMEDPYSNDYVRPPTELVHFDLKHHNAEILLSFPDPSVFAFYGRHFVSRIMWHPTKKTFLWDMPVYASPHPRWGDKKALLQVFQFDLRTKKQVQISNNADNNFNPVWSTDGQNVLWIRREIPKFVYGDKRDVQYVRHLASQSQLWIQRGSSTSTVYLPQLRGIHQIQLLPKIADWSRYRKRSIEPLAGKDK